MIMGLHREGLLSISRVKGKLGVIILSDMTTADRKHLETFAFDPRELDVPQSKFTFPREALTDQDCQAWRNFWRQHTVEKLPASHTLGSLDFHHTQKMDLVP